MKNALILLITIILSASPFPGLISVVQAQSWLWGREGKGPSSEGWVVATDAAGNVYGGGINMNPDTSISFGSFRLPAYTTPDLYQSFWVKYNPAGTVLWAGGTTAGDTWIQSITTDPSGNLIVMGAFVSRTMQIGAFTLTNLYADGSAQYYLAKISPSGTVLWATNDGNTVPETGFIYGLIGPGKVRTDDSGNIYITSSFKKPTITIGTTTLTNYDLSGGSYDVFVAKYTPAGLAVWAASFGGNNDDYAFGLAITSSGYVYVSGSYWSDGMNIGPAVLTNTTIGSQGYIAKFSAAGAPLWAEAVTGTHAYSTGLVKDNSDNIYMLGSFDGSAVNIGSTSTGRVFPTATAAAALFLVKLTSIDSVSWVRVLDAGSDIFTYSISWASCAQKVWVSAYSNGNVYKGPGDILGRITGGTDPVFIARYDTSGNAGGFASLGTGGDDETEIACDAEGNVYLCSDLDGAFTMIGPDSLTGIPSGEAFMVGKYFNDTIVVDTTYARRDTTVICNISGIPLTAPGGCQSYYWNNDSTGQTMTIYASGQYYVYCINCSVVQVDTFNVVMISDTVYTHTDTLACRISDATFITLTAPAGTHYLWYDETTDSTHNEYEPGPYWVSYSSGCNFVTDTFNVTFSTGSPPCTTGISAVSSGSASEVDFYPDPALDELTIVANNSVYYAFTVSNSLGQVFIRQQLSGSQSKAAISTLPAGLYYLTFIGDSGSIVKKFVKL